jgi:ABC-2 type transport system ATP-binding protein
VALIAALARRADLYVLDEPTSGLDPVMEAAFRTEIDRVKGEGATVLLSSHILSEVEELCDRVTIIRAGKTVETGTLAELRHLTRTSFRVTTVAEVAAMTAIAGVHDADTDALRPVLQQLAVIGVAGLAVSPPSLEELFLRHYGDERRAPEVAG